MHWNIDIKPTALRGARIHYVGYIHWNTDTAPTALPIDNTLNMHYLHLKNMIVLVDVWAFILWFLVSTPIHFMLLTCKQCLAK